MQNALISILSFLFLIWLMFVLFPRLAVDWYRQEVFTLRDELFDLASNGVIDFNHPAYGYTRQIMNGFIRYAHQMSIMHLFYLWAFFRNEGKAAFLGNHEKLIKVMSTLDDEQKKILVSYYQRLHMVTLKLVLFESPILCSLIVGLIFIRLGYRQLRGWISSRLSELDDLAYAAGQ